MTKERLFMSLKKRFIDRIIVRLYKKSNDLFNDFVFQIWKSNNNNNFEYKGKVYGTGAAHIQPLLLPADLRQLFQVEYEKYEKIINEKDRVEEYLLKWCNLWSVANDALLLERLNQAIPPTIRDPEYANTTHEQAELFKDSPEYRLMTKRLMLNSLGKYL